MGASDRSAREFPSPMPVWYSHDWTGRGWASNKRHVPSVKPALLIEWRQWDKEWGVSRPKWEALIVLVDGGGERPPSVTLKWTAPDCLRPMDVTLPTTDPGMPKRE